MKQRKHMTRSRLESKSRARAMIATLALAALGLLLRPAGLISPSLAQDQSTELKLIQHEALNGSTSAQLIYGLAYLEGRHGLAPDTNKAVQWIRRSAKGGNSYAMLMMGKFCADGQGHPKDPQQAVSWWQQAAQKKDAHAQYLLGKAYLDGFGVNKDAAKGIKWLEKSGAQGNRHAQYLLARTYSDGKHVAADKQRSRSWLERAAEQPHSKAVNPFTMIYDLIMASTPVAQQSPAILMEKAAEGDPQAEYELGERYKNGTWDVEQNDARALAWISRAARSGHKVAMKTLAAIYAKGKLGVSADQNKAKQWQQRARTARSQAQ